MSISILFPITLAMMFAQDSGVPGPTGGTSETDPLAQAKAEEAYWKQVEAAAKAKTAAIEAEIAEQKKNFGAIPGQTSITGKSEVKTGAAKAEALLLVSRAADSAAARVATEVGDGFCAREAADDKSRQIMDSKLDGRSGVNCTVLLLTSLTDLSMAPVDLYEFQLAQLGNLLEVAVRANEEVLATTPDAPAVSEPPSGGRSFFPAIGAGLEFASKAGSYFLTDYEFGAVDVTGPDRLVVNAVAGALNRTKCCFFTPDVLAAAKVGDVAAELAPLATQYGTVIKLSNQSKARAAQLTQFQPAAAARLTAAAGLADTAAASYKSFVDALVTVPQGQTEAPLTRILRARALRDKLAPNPQGAPPRILIVSDKQAAAYYTKKNLWTFLGGPPLYTMGGVAISYTLLDGQSRQILGAGSVAKHGGYRSVGQVEKLFK